MSIQKGTIPPRYDEAFKSGAIKMVTEPNRPSKEVAAEPEYASTLLSHGSNMPVFSPVQPTGKTATTSVSVSLKLKNAHYANSLPRKTRSLMS